MNMPAESSRRFRLLPEDRYLGWTPYVWLVYLPTLFVQPAFGGGPASTWVLTSIATLVFLPLYFRGYWARGREAYGIIAAITAIGAALVMVNASAFVLFIYAAAFAGVQRPTKLAVRLLALLSAIAVVESFALQLPLFAWGWAPLLIWMIGGVNAHYATVRQGNVALKRAHEEIEHLATVAERERIARDLHDLLGHTLSLITLKSSLASRVADRDPARAIAEIRDVERISREALAEVRSAVAGYREAGLARAVASAEQMLSAAGIETSVAIDPLQLSANEEGVLALAVRESVTNVVKHSRASSCSISLERDGSTRRLSVSDNGSWKKAPGGSGLVGMRERVEAIGGELSIERDNGTRLVIDLSDPVRDAAADSSPVHIVA